MIINSLTCGIELGVECCVHDRWSIIEIQLEPKFIFSLLEDGPGAVEWLEAHRVDARVHDDVEVDGRREIVPGPACNLQIHMEASVSDVGSEVDETLKLMGPSEEEAAPKKHKPLVAVVAFASGD